MAKYDWIICSGDSFTFGDELGGDVLYPNYTSFKFPNARRIDEEKSEHQTNLAKTLADRKRKAEPKNLKRYENECKRLAFPEMLKYFHPNKNIKNVAYSGIGNKEIIHRAQQTMFTLSKEKRVPFESMLFFIMLTTPLRVGMPEYYYDSQFGYQTGTPGNPEKNPKNRWITFNHMFETYKDWDYLWESISDVLAFKTIAETLGAKVVLIDSCMFTNFINTYKDEGRTNKQMYVSQAVDIKFVMADTAKRVGGRQQLAGGHMSKTVHDHFAQQLALYVADLEKNV